MENQVENKLPYDPSFVRERVTDLCGEWLFSFDGKEYKKINVPFCPQSELSGIGVTKPFDVCYYKKNFAVNKNGSRAVLKFGAVDYETVVFVNGRLAGTHKGGYTPFEFDITDIATDGENLLELIVYDQNKSQAFGKQSFKPESFGCMYTRTTGIWQPVTVEYRPENYIKSIKFYPDINAPAVETELLVFGKGDYEIKVYYEGKEVGSCRGQAHNRLKTRIELCEKHLWELGAGRLYDVEINFCGDKVKSYFGLREARYSGYDFMLNGKPVFQKLVLDQGYYPDGIYTAKDQAALQCDIDISLRLGFNGVRMHQKVFDPRFLYLCDKAGYMAWGEFPSWGCDFSSPAVTGQFLSEWEEAMRRDFNHPCVITWCPINEAWGDFDDAKRARDVRVIDEVYRFTKEYDCTRPAVDASGGYHGHETDLFDFHCYENAASLKKYLDELEFNDVLNVPLLYAEGENLKYKKGLPVNISEYGGICFGKAAKDSDVKTVNGEAVASTEAWGYGKGETDGGAFVARYKELTELLFKYKKLSGFCYTQLYDVEQEQNGFYNYDRSDKLTEEEKDEIKRINSLK